MYLPFIFALILSISGYVYAKDKPYEPEFFMMFAGAAVGAVIGTALAAIIGVQLTTADDYEKVVYKTEIISLSDSQELQGQFFLGTGSIRGRKMYYYYVDTPKGAISQKVPASGTYIEEVEDPDPPRILFIEYKDVSPNWYFANFVSKVRGVEKYNQIVIPEGSIKRQFNPNQ